MEQFETTIIKLSKAFKIPPLKPDDIAQELRIHLWEQEKRHRGKIRDYKNWAYICCRNKLKKLHRYYTQQKRDIRKEVSLEALQEKGFEI